MKYLLNKKFIALLICILLIFSINIFASEQEISNDDFAISDELVTSDELAAGEAEDFDNNSLGDNEYASMIYEYLLNEDFPLEERVYSEYNIPFDFFKELSRRLILGMYNTEFSLVDTYKIYEGAGYTKTASFIKALDSITTDKMNDPDITSNECFIHNGKYETRTVIVFPNEDTATINISYNKAIPYLSFGRATGFLANDEFNFDKDNVALAMLDDYCVTKGENLSQYADMDEFVRNLVLVLIGIVLMIIIVSMINKKTKDNHINDTIQTIDNNVTLNTATDDTTLVAILTAAIASYEGTNENNIRIKTIRKNIRWKNI